MSLPIDEKDHRAIIEAYASIYGSDTFPVIIYIWGDGNNGKTTYCKKRFPEVPWRSYEHFTASDALRLMSTNKLTFVEANEDISFDTTGTNILCVHFPKQFK